MMTPKEDLKIYKLLKHFADCEDRWMNHGEKAEIRMDWLTEAAEICRLFEAKFSKKPLEGQAYWDLLEKTGARVDKWPKWKLPSDYKTMNRVICRWCGANPAIDPKIALTRVNEKGVIGIWECNPYCIPDRLDRLDEELNPPKRIN